MGDAAGSAAAMLDLTEIQGTARGTDYDAVDVLGGTTLNLGGILQLDFSQTFAKDTMLNPHLRHRR